MDIRLEQPTDAAAIRAVHELSFPTPGEADLVDHLRSDGELVFSLAAILEGKVVGHAAFSRMKAPFKALGLGPVAVLPEYRRRGVAARLVAAGLACAETETWEGIFVLGDPAFYSRFGFSVNLAAGFTSAYAGPHFMAVPLSRNGLPTLKGEIDYPRAFAYLK